MSGTESILFWLSAVLLAASFFSSLLSQIFKKKKVFSFAGIFLYTALILITIFGIIRWTSTGHPPFVTKFESMITSIWFILLIYTISTIFMRKSEIILLPVTLITFLMLGWSSSLSPEASPLTEALTNVWLFIHASFATSGAAAFLIAASFSIIYLLGEKNLAGYERLIQKIPEFSKIPGYIFNFMIFGLILWGVMIISGSIWAHVAWGRYWAWDPIELWSLISWLLYGLLFHARLTFKMSNKLYAMLTIIAALTVIFSLWGVGYIYETIHEYG